MEAVTQMINKTNTDFYFYNIFFNYISYGKKNINK